MSAPTNEEICEMLATMLHFIPTDEGTLYEDAERMCAEIRASAAQPVSEQEPVATVHKEGDYWNFMSREVNSLPDGTHNLFAALPVSKDAEDAARYRWLRNPPLEHREIDVCDDCMNIIEGKYLDAIIDAAMAQQEGSQ